MADALVIIVEMRAMLPFLAFIFCLPACHRGGRLVVEPPVVQDNILPLLLYKTVGTCAGNDLMFQYLTAAGMQLWSDPEAPIVVGQADIFLFKDRSYRIIYREHTDGVKTHESAREGLYSYSGGVLNMEGFGIAEISVHAGRVGMNLKFVSDIHTPGLAGMILPAVLNVRPEGLESRSEYCTH